MYACCCQDIMAPAASGLAAVMATAPLTCCSWQRGQRPLGASTKVRVLQRRLASKNIKGSKPFFLLLM